MAIEIVDLPIENGGSFHSYVSLPEGKMKPWPKLQIFHGHLLQLDDNSLPLWHRKRRLGPNLPDVRVEGTMKNL